MVKSLQVMIVGFTLPLLAASCIYGALQRHNWYGSQPNSIGEYTPHHWDTIVKTRGTQEIIIEYPNEVEYKTISVGDDKIRLVRRVGKTVGNHRPYRQVINTRFATVGDRELEKITVGMREDEVMASPQRALSHRDIVFGDLP